MIQVFERLTRENWKLSLLKETKEISYNKQLLITARSTFSKWLCSTFIYSYFNRPFPSCFEPHYESEAKSKVFVMEIGYPSYANETNFHMKSLYLASLS